MSGRPAWSRRWRLMVYFPGGRLHSVRTRRQTLVSCCTTALLLRPRLALVCLSGPADPQERFVHPGRRRGAALAAVRPVHADVLHPVLRSERLTVAGSVISTIGALVPRAAAGVAIGQVSTPFPNSLCSACCSRAGRCRWQVPADCRRWVMGAPGLELPLPGERDSTGVAGLDRLVALRG